MADASNMDANLGGFLPGPFETLAGPDVYSAMEE